MAAPLKISSLDVEFANRRSPGETAIAAVREVSLSVERGEVLGVVGESGSGKTQLFMAAMGLLPANARARGSVLFEGEELLAATPRTLNRIRGSKLTMVFQNPMTSLTPHLRIGAQLSEVLTTHQSCSRRFAEEAAIRMLHKVGIPDPRRRMQAYPHELSGGLRQRVMIGMSLLCSPSVLIADEPTTALDVTIQAQIIDLLRVMRTQYSMAMVLISHDLAVVGALADRIIVLYCGRIVESGGARQLLRHARHPYTAELLRCMPRVSGPVLARMATMAGQPPTPGVRIEGCDFAARCPRAAPRCRQERPLLTGSVQQAACHYPLS